MVFASPGVNDIVSERLRQIASEGYEAAHDDEHVCGEMAQVAAELALEHTSASIDRAPHMPDLWGLLQKHKDTRRRLVIAGALIAAEIDRLDRKAKKDAAGSERTEVRP